MINTLDTMLLLLIIMMAIGMCIWWIKQLVDVINSDFTNPSDKTMWIILLIFLSPFSMFLYDYYGKKQKTKYNALNINDRECNNYDKSGKWKI